MYGNGDLVVTFEREAVLELYFFVPDNLWILQVTLLPTLLAGLVLHLFIMRFMWKSGLKQPIDKIFFVDFSASTFRILTILLNKSFFLTLNHNDPGVFLCVIEQIAHYGPAYVHRLAGACNALVRSKYTCHADLMLSAELRRKFHKKVYLTSTFIGIFSLGLVLSTLLVPGHEKSLQLWSNCRRTPEITRYNFKDFYLPHQKSEYDPIIFALTIISLALVNMVSIIVEIYYIVKTQRGMKDHLEKNKVISESTRAERRRKNILTFKSTLLLAVNDVLLFFTVILGM